MSERVFFLPASRARVTEAIRGIEAMTSAEIVVAVRRVSGHYRHADYLFGFVASMILLGVLLFHPTEFEITTMPLQMVLVFVVASFVCAKVPPLRRLLVAKSLRRAAVVKTARAAFVEQGITRTRGRSGILVFVSTFERTVEVVADIGIDPSRLGDPWKQTLQALNNALEHGVDFEAFLRAFEGLGPVLSPTLPRQEGDTNELPDEVA